MDDEEIRPTTNLDEPKSSTPKTVRTTAGNECVKSLWLQRFDFTENKRRDMQNDTDPENHFYTTVHTECYTLESTVITKDKLSVIHFNCRSLNSNFSKIISLVETNKKYIICNINL
ncbi:hypothetical protein ILYODFUR_003878 [Ilyodon furcidens]|uniref:Uncharacterized protein n=1 Tax=Ilyodon furcidens TaxID=33524 RepID=A0ABV0TRP4_9TELE